jgi:hypothetical protein
LIKQARSRGDVLVQPIKEIVLQYLFSDQIVDVTLLEISENALANGWKRRVPSACLLKGGER